MLKALLIAGVVALKGYIGAHVLTCLAPAFLLAGAMVTFVSREAILGYLGERAEKIKSFSMAAGSSFFVAACSCTVIPVSSGLYYSGAGIGVAFIILWVAPAANILALIYTVSKHLSLLKTAGIVTDEKRGAQMFYSLRVGCALKFFDCVEAVMYSVAKEDQEILAPR